MTEGSCRPGVRAGRTLTVAATAALLTSGLVAAAAPVAQAEPVNGCWSTDNGDPVLTSMSRTPSAVNVTAGSKKINFTLQAHDTGGPGTASGISSGFVSAFRSTGTNFRFVSAALKKNAAGDWVGAAKVPRWTLDGHWTISSVSLSDKAGNGKFYSSSDLGAKGFPTGFDVTSTPDNTAPKLKAFTFSPGSVNTTNGTKTVTVTAKAVDSQSGVSGIFASAQSTASNPRGASAFLAKVKGTATTYRGKMTIPTWARTSTWHITNVFLNDKIGNSTQLTYAQLGAKGFKRNLGVVSGSDVAKPKLASFSRSPGTADVRSQSKSIAVSLRARDAKSGVSFVTVNLHGPDGFSAGSFLTRKSGTAKDGVWSGKVKIGKCAASKGTWKFTVVVTDLAGNSHTYSPTSLKALHFPSTVAVNSHDNRQPQAQVVGQPGTTDDITVAFNEAVNGINATSATLHEQGFPDNGPDLPGTWTCKDSAGANANCATGSVRKATFNPAANLNTFTSYEIELNPEHTLGVTDLAGNPFIRNPLNFFTGG